MNDPLIILIPVEKEDMEDLVEDVVEAATDELVAHAEAEADDDDNDDEDEDDDENGED